MRSVSILCVLIVCLFFLVAEFNGSSGWLFKFGRRRRRGGGHPPQQAVTVKRTYNMTVNIEELVIELNNNGVIRKGDLQVGGGMKNVRVQVYEENGRKMALLESMLHVKIPLDTIMRHASSVRDLEDN